jgi:hypothetical protein
MVQEEQQKIIETGEGFYNSEGIYAPNFIYGPDFELLKDQKDSYLYPVNGWVWAESLSASKSWFN